MKINIKNDTQNSNNYDVLSEVYSAFNINGEEIELNDEEVLVPYGTYKIQKGDRLAQLVIVPIWTPELETVEEFESESARGEKGFGSSGTR